ncbi:MAG: hypothetical protein M3N91_12300 [Pseudomonadota bacterium]|nr:hypothetical protein [Pseudomonadota bacterium]
MSTAAISPSILKASTPVAPAKGQTGTAQVKTASRATAASQAAASATAVISAQAAALKEASETSAQTAKEAAGGDRQAQRLLTKESAARTGSAPVKSDSVSPKGSRISVKA